MLYWSAGKLYLREEALALVFIKWELKGTFQRCHNLPSGSVKSVMVGSDRLV